MNIWQILEIDPTSDQKLIKRAYVRRLKECHPEDDQAAFMELNAAYEYAKQYAHYDYEDQLYEPGRTEQATDLPIEITTDSPPQPSEPVDTAEAEIPDHVSDFLDFFALRVDSDVSVFGQGEAELSQQESEALDELCIKLDQLFNDASKFKKLESWSELFGEPALESAKLKRYFVYTLLDAIRGHIEKHRELNHFTPRITLKIADFFSPESQSDGPALVDELVFKFEKMRELAKKASRVIEIQLEDRNVWWPLKIMSDPSGRVTRTGYFTALVLLMIAYFSALGIFADSIKAANAQEQLFDISKLESVNAEQSEMLPQPGAQFDSMHGDRTTKFNDRDEAIVESALPYKRSEYAVNLTRSIAPPQPIIQDYGPGPRAYNFDSSVEFTLSDYINPLWIINTVAVWALFCLTSRRLHDSGNSGWVIAMILVPYLGIIAIAMYVMFPSEMDENDYGVYPGPWQETMGQFRIDIYKLFRDLH